MKNKEISMIATNPFLFIFERIEDSRNQKLIHYTLSEILFLVLIGTLCGCDQLTIMIVFGEEKIDWFRKYYPYKYGMPSHDTLSKVLGMIDKKEFEKVFVCWVSTHFGLSATELINIDGKRLNGSADKMAQSKKRNEGGQYAEIIVNVYANAAGITLAQNNVSDKMDEIKGALELLDWLEVQGCCISGDANFCRNKIVEKIRAKKADYLLALKGHLPKILDATKKTFEKKETEKTYFETEETGHGRYEKRNYRAIGVEHIPKIALDYFSDLSQIVEVKRIRIVQRTGRQSEEIHYYVTSSNSTVDEIAHKIRGHWAIENNLHHTLDVSFGEDDSRVRQNNAASNLSLIRKASLNILTKHPDSGTVKSKRLRLAISDKKRSDILQNIMMR
jgi:predicted transposase YbfD/YdcC